MIVKGPDGDGRHGDVGKKGSLPWHVCASNTGFSPPSGAIMGGAAASAGQMDAEEVTARTTAITIISSHDGSLAKKPVVPPSQYASCSAYSGENSK